MISLFDPVQLGALSLQNRIVMAPMTRTRASAGRVPNELMRHYYCQRATAGMVIVEPTSVAPRGVGYPNTPGIWSSSQVAGWVKITDAVHARDGKIILPLWHVGRVSDPEYLNGEIPVAPSAIRCEGYVELLEPEREYVMPRALHQDEIKGIVADFAQAARNARQAGFDGVQIQGAEGYLIDQFLRDGSNQRQDKYGGPVENRARFLLEIVDACSGIWGADRVGVQLSPYRNARSVSDSNPSALFNYLARKLGQRNVGFIFLLDVWKNPRLTGTLRDLFGGCLISGDHSDPSCAQRILDSGQADAVAFGRAFIANPDLVRRFRSGAPLNHCVSASPYGDGPRGYTDYAALDSG